MALNQNIALLIDCDSVSHWAIEGALENRAKYGKENVRHAMATGTTRPNWYFQ